MYVVVGLFLSTAIVRETLHHARRESSVSELLVSNLTPLQVFWRTSLQEPSLSAVTQAGFVNNLNDGMAWGLFPAIFAMEGLSLAEVAALAALYPAVWGGSQLVTGALSDRWGRKWLIAGGMVVQAMGILAVARASTVSAFVVGQVLLGVGTAMMYPTILASFGDVAHPSWRASAVGTYRFWRDLGYVAGALLAGFVADALGVAVAVELVGLLTLFSGGVVALRMRETLLRRELTSSGSN